MVDWQGKMPVPSPRQPISSRIGLPRGTPITLKKSKQERERKKTRREVHPTGTLPLPAPNSGAKGVTVVSSRYSTLIGCMKFI